MTSLSPPVPVTIAEHAIFLDLDGTLIEFGETPHDVDVPARLLDLLAGLLERADGALAIVSGRRIEAIDALLRPLALPVAGLHGLERRDAAGRVRHYAGEVSAAVAASAAALREFAARDRRLLIEDKDVTVALHYRAAPDHAPAVERFATELEAALDPQLSLQRGHSVIEVRPAGLDKGTAIADFMREPPFAGRRAVFVGDDQTDEHGFAVVNASAGLSVKVGPGATLAHTRLPDPDAVYTWLAASLDPT